MGGMKKKGKEFPVRPSNFPRYFCGSLMVSTLRERGEEERPFSSFLLLFSFPLLFLPRYFFFSFHDAKILGIDDQTRRSFHAFIFIIHFHVSDFTFDYFKLFGIIFLFVFNFFNSTELNRIFIVLNNSSILYIL